jgi:hypothetical protein
MDFAPTLPKALIQTTQDGRLMLKQNKFSLRSLRRGLAGKVSNPDVAMHHVIQVAEHARAC